ncbi:MAG TPA: DUF4397 domain-containing protein, partial [Candidatus Tumulicola sp.]
MTNFFIRAALLAMLAALGGCGNSSASSATPAANAASVQVRFVEGAPLLEALVNGQPTDIGAAYLSVNGTTVASTFPYAAITQFQSFRAGTLSLTASDSLGYTVGPIKTSAPLQSGKAYTVILLGTYPAYEAVVYEEPATSSSAQLSLYEASPSVRSADFGRFDASSHSNFVKLGSASYGSVASVLLGKSASNFGGYAGQGNKPFANGALTLAAVNSFDQRNVLPFNAATRMSLILIDPK